MFALIKFNFNFSFFQILHHIIIGLLFYTKISNTQPVTNDSKMNPPTMRVLNPVSINGLMDPTPDMYSDIAVDTLITRVQEVSNRYRKDVNGTIADIQHILNNDLTLPRLTRGEIIDLIENYTKTDPEELKKKVAKGREDYQRAIMLVLPYTPKNTDNFSIEELYTKPPITHIIGAEEPKINTTSKRPTTNKHIEILALEPSTSRPIVMKRPVKPQKFAKPADIPQSFKVQTNIPEVKHRKEVVVKSAPSRPEQYFVPTVMTSTQKPVTRFSNHRYPEDLPRPVNNEPLKIIKAPILMAKPPVKSEVFSGETQQKFTQEQDWQPTKATTEPKPHRHVYKATMSSTMRPKIVRTTMRPFTSTPSTTTTTVRMKPLANVELPDDLREALKDLDLGEVRPVKPIKLFSSQYDSSLTNFPKKELSNDNIKDILDAIGAAAPTTMKTTTIMPDISEVVNNLSPDMRELLMTFGLIDNPNKPSSPLRAITDSPPLFSIDELDGINPVAFTQFKPLPDSAPSREDMKDFLAGYGLTGNSGSQRFAKKLKEENTTKDQPQKSEPLTDVSNIDLSFVPESMQAVLADIGLINKTSFKTVINEDQIQDEAKQETHVFNPEQTYVSENEIQRLSQLLDTIKKLEKMNRTATPEDLQDLDLENVKELTKILKQESSLIEKHPESFSLTLDQQNFGPNPLDFDLSPDKNEVKRQQSSTTTSTTEAPSLTALEESFGGNTGTSTATIDETLPAPRRTGFYYLVDWNSFLEVGEDDKKVNIRFTPRAGDPSRFLRVNVP